MVFNKTYKTRGDCLYADKTFNFQTLLQTKAKLRRQAFKGRET